MLRQSPSRVRLLAAALVAGLAGVSSGSSPAAVPLFASSSSAGTAAAATSLTLARPAGTAAGHVLLAAVSVRDETGAAAPAGWVEVVRTSCSGNDDVDLTQAVFVRVAASAEPDEHTFTALAAAGIAGTVVAYAGVDADAPVLASGGQIRRNSRLVTAPRVTTTVAGALLAAAFSNTGRSTLSAPAGMTARAEAAAAPDVRLLAADELQAATGTTGDRTASAAQVSNCAVGHLVALRPAPDPPESTSPPVVTGVAQEGAVLSATTGTWSSSPASYSYRWQRGDDQAWEDVEGGAASDYTVSADDVGARLRVVVTATNSGGSGTATSATTEPVLPAPPSNLEPPAVSGDAVEQATLTVDPGTWTGSPSFGFEWQRSADGADWETIAGAADATYEAGSGDVGAYLRTVVTATNAGGASTAVSGPVGPVEPGGPPVPLQPPTISGWQQEGETLSATTGTWAGSPTGYAYLWQRSDDGSSWSDVGAAASYVLGAEDSGRLVRVVVTATNAAGATSASSEPLGPIGPALPPANVDPPALTGVPTYGVPLQATTGTWVNAPRDFAYRWLRSADGGTAWEPIEGAVGAAYVPGVADVGLLLAAEVTASNATGATAAVSAPSEPVGAPPPENLAAPVVTGDAVEGSTLVASAGEWTNGPDDFAHTWQRCDAAGCTEIRWATDPEYTLWRDDVGFEIRAVVTASNPSGAATAISGATGVVLPLPPLNEEPPLVTGVAAEGETLTASAGDWQSSAAISHAYRWQRSSDGGASWTDLEAPATAAYVITAADVGSILRVVVTASNTGGSTEAPSAATSPVTPPGTPTLLRGPAISGVVQERGRLNALAGTWSGSPAFTYAWQRSTDGGSTWSGVPRGDGSRYTAVAADVGALIRVLVTGSNAHGSVTVASEAWLIQPTGNGALHLANSTWYCDDPVDLELVRVTIVDGFGRDAIRFDNCSGRIGRVEITTNGIDGLKVRNNAPVAHDLTIESGYVRCTGHPDGAHQDGIQVLGGSGITFRNLVIWCDSEEDFGGGVNSSALIAAGGAAGASTPTDVVIEQSVVGPGTTNGVLVADSVRSGIRTSVACPDRTPNGGPVLLEPTAVDGIDVDNEKPELDDPRCSSFEAAVAWVEATG